MRRFFSIHKDPQAPSVTHNTLLPEEMVPLFTGTCAECQEYALVLSSQNIPNYFQDTPEGPWELVVPLDLHIQAEAELNLYLQENQNFDPVMALPPVILSLQPLWVLAIPTLVTLVQFSGRIHDFDELGLNDAHLTLHGEWWRAFTALTLHADSHHLISNFVSGYFVLSLLSSRVALTRIAPLLWLGCGVANFLVAATVRNDFYSLGFSTYVFATLGALASIEFRLLPKERTFNAFKRFEPILSAGFLVILMGLGQDTDILAHIYGFLCGIAVGWLPRKASIQGRVTTWLTSDFIAAGTCYAGIVLCWIRALRGAM